MEDNEREQFGEDLKSRNDPIENWPTAKLKKEAGDDSGKGKSIQRDDLGIE